MTKSTRWFAATVLSIALIALLSDAAISILLGSIVRQSSYVDSVSDPYARIVDYPFTLRQQDCQVIIYGDSTAITGYDPLVIQQATNLKVCNIAQTRSIFVSLGTFALDRYLAKNPRPQYLVFQLSPEGFHREHDWTNLGDALPLIELPRQTSKLSAYLTLMVHYKATLNYLIEALRNKYSSTRREEVRAMQQKFASTFQAYYQHKGSFVMPLPSETTCSTVHSKWSNVDSQWIPALKKTYSVQGTQVLVNSSPVPDCDRDLPLYRRELAKYIDNRVDAYPISMYNDLDRHFSEEGRTRASRVLADQINVLEAQRHSTVQARR